MDSGIEISDTELVFSRFSLREIGRAKFCKSFNIDLIDIRFIALSARLIVDDESIFIVLFDKAGKLYPIPDKVLDTKGLKDFEDYFGLNPIREDWQKFQYKDHYGKIDKIIYPKEYYWEDLFENDWKLKVRTLYSAIYPKSFFGNLKKNLQII